MQLSNVLQMEEVMVPKYHVFVGMGLCSKLELGKTLITYEGVRLM